MGRYILGITGPTGSGKTTILHELLEQGFSVIDCDAYWYGLVESSEEIQYKLKESFGDIFKAPGLIDRKKLASIVFNDRSKLAELNAIVFESMQDSISKVLAEYSMENFAIDGVTIIESGISKLCTTTIAIIADDEVRLSRIMDRDNIPESEALSRMKSQKSNEWYKQHCDMFFDNSKNDMDSIKEFIDRLL